MLLTKTLIVKWNGSNRKHYEEKGYIYTKHRDEFEVKIKDLPNGSQVYVKVKCDCDDCKSPILKPIIWQDYLRFIHNDGEYYCHKCNMKLFGNENISKARTKNSKSFAQWGIDNICSDFLEKYWDYEKNDKLGINPLEISYGNTSKKVWIICQEKDYHCSYDITCGSFTSQGSRCSYCSGKKVHPNDSLGALYPKSLEVWSDKNTKSPMDYSPFSHEKVWWKCLDGKHEDYFRDIKHSNIYDFRCVKCVQERDESFIQGKTNDYLNRLGYNVLHEHDCTLIPRNPRTKNITNNTLPFDNEIIVNEIHILIEVHGIQHYEVCGFHKMHAKRNNTNPEYELHYQKLKDRYKSYVAYRMGYKYLAIPYWTNNKQEEYKTLIDNKIDAVK